MCIQGCLTESVKWISSQSCVVKWPKVTTWKFNLSDSIHGTNLISRRRLPSSALASVTDLGGVPGASVPLSCGPTLFGFQGVFRKKMAWQRLGTYHCICWHQYEFYEIDLMKNKGLPKADFVLQGVTGSYLSPVQFNRFAATSCLSTSNQTILIDSWVASIRLRVWEKRNRDPARSARRQLQSDLNAFNILWHVIRMWLLMLYLSFILHNFNH